MDVADDLSTFLNSFWPAAFNIKLDVLSCDKDVHGAVHVIGEALAIINQNASSTVQNYFKAFLHIIDNRNVFLQSFNDCKQTGPEFEQGFEKMIPLMNLEAAQDAITKATLHNPWTFPRNILAAKSAFSAGDYAKCGKALGENLKLVLKELNQPNFQLSTQNFEEFIESFWTSAFGESLHLKGCTCYAEPAWDLVSEAIAMVDESPLNIIKAYNHIKSNQQAFDRAFNGCDKSWKSVANGLVQLQSFNSLGGFTHALTQAVIKHPI
jgi:hypothetical protein